MGNNNQLKNNINTPGSYGSQIGYNNSLRLVQQGNNLIFSYTQVGNNNVQEVVQRRF